MKKIAIIGGSGLENPDILQRQERIVVETPYGAPSSDFCAGPSQERRWYSCRAMAGSTPLPHRR